MDPTIVKRLLIGLTAAAGRALLRLWKRARLWWRLLLWCLRFVWRRRWLRRFLGRQLLGLIWPRRRRRWWTAIRRDGLRLSAALDRAWRRVQARLEELG